LYLDIDQFKSINDTQGHAVGDGLLRAFARRLRGCVRGVDTVARLGGDEFAIILEQLNDAAEACAIGKKLVEAMESGFSLDEGAITVTTSVGIAVMDSAGEDGDALLKRADRALYQAKEHGRNTYRLAA
jgi:diguanylate cyclase (GGDEF)-like protein